jgi:aspartate racemase
MEENTVNRAVVSSTPVAEQFPHGQQQPAGAPSHIDLPTDRPRMREQTYREGCRSFVLSRKLTAALKGLSEQEHVDLFVTLLAAFKVLLARYSRQEDIVVATPIMAGSQGQTEDIETFHSSTVALRTDLSGDPTFREVLCRVREVCLTANRHHETQSKIPAIEPQLDRDLTISQLRQVFCAMHKSAGQNTGGQETSLDRVGLEPAAVDSELCLFAWPEGERLEGVVKYNAELFEASTIERLARHYATLLESVVDNPDQPITTLPLLTPAERHQLLVEWNDTKSEYPENLCVHQLFETRARNTPDAVAAVFESQRLTYRELNGQANRVARDLRKLGVEPDTLVGLCVERSLEMLVGILAILKAGGAYVPLDPIYPNKRLSTMLSEAQPRVLLTQRHLISRFPEYAGPVIFIDNGLASVMGESNDNLGIELTPESLAYVIFTSGSTGIPKGVLISHRSLINHSTAMARHYDLQPSDRVLQFASFGFDVAAEEIFSTWLSGAAVVLWPAVAAVKDFLKFIEQQEITVLNLPAAYWHEWVSESEQLRVPPIVRLVVVGSDKVSAKKFSIWKKQIGERVRLCNAYGPTETTITATIYEPRGNGQYSMTGCVPIGRPIANTKAYVLDQRLNPVPIGVPGELHIAGAGLARGYLNRPELTAESFIANPFCDGTGARIYKTGDLVRYLPDGNLEYLGRIGNQVKLRGYRIELGEIEALLRQHPRVQDAAVIVREDTPGDRRLVAYVVQKPEAACAASELRTYLREKLPDYMLPSALVMLSSFPLTPSRKVDTRALPAPDHSKRDSERCFFSPGNPVERQLVSLWEELLAARPIGTHDNFFDLGGNSLLGLKLISRIGKTFGKDLPVAALYQAATVEQLAKLIIQPSSPNPLISLVPIQTTGSKPAFFWVHGDSSGAFLPRCLGPDQPLFGLGHQSHDGKPARYTEVETIAAHYLEEIRTVQPEGPYFLGGYSFGGTVAVEMAQQLKRQGEEVSVLFLLDPEFPVEEISNSVNRPKRIPLRDEAKRHLRNLAMLRHRDKLVYILVRIRDKMKHLVRIGDKMKQRTPRISKILKNILCKLYPAMGRPIPLFLRIAYIVDIYGQALRSYVPQPYPGPAIYFKLKNRSRDPRLDWDRLLTGKLDVYELAGDHHDLVEEPSVRLWAEKLKDALQTRNARRTINDTLSPPQSV